MKYIAVFCSSKELDEKYVGPSKEFARLLVKNGYNMIWGGTDTGLMKVIADEVQKGGGKLHGVTIERFHNLARKNADEMILAKNLGERKAALLEKGDAIVALVGGIGTLDELTEIIELRKTGHHNKPIVILNTEGFYEGLRAQLQKMKDDGFLAPSHELPLIDELAHFADTPEEAIEYINKTLV